ncbi:MAG: ABC-type transport auxiliary lipoprotein family protein [Aquisalimonadaceae bacterium]
MRFMPLALIMTFTLLTGCASLPGGDKHQQTFQLLPPELSRSPDDRLQADLTITRMTSRPGYDSSAIAYRQSDFELRYFAENRWADRPTRMLHPALTATLDGLGPFRYVVSSQSGISTRYRLDVELIRLEQDFQQQPSRVHLAIQVRLLDEQSREIRLDRALAVTETAPSDDPQGGVIAANNALEKLLHELSALLRKTLADLDE